MWHLLKSEVSRFRNLAIFLGIAHLLLLRGLLAVFDEYFGQDAAKTSIGLLIYSLAGLIFGLYQIGSYKRLNRWTYLVHRPLAPAKIFLALNGGAAAFFFAVFSLPMLLMTLYVDFMTPQVVDFRQYLLTPFLFGILLCFYLAGCFIVLSASRAAFLVLALPVFFLTRDASGLWVFLPQLVVLLWLYYLAYSAFKPDLGSHLKRPLPVAMSSLALQYSFFWMASFALALTYSTIVAFQEEGWRSYAAFAWNDYFQEGTIDHVEYLDSAGDLAHGLRRTDTERARHLLKQIELADVFESPGPRFARFPVRDQLMFMDRRWEFHDEENGVYWTFSHDRMLFHGRDARTGEDAGWLGTSGPLPDAETAASQRFSEIPYVVGHRYVVTPQKLYEYHAKRRSLDLRFDLAGDERFASPLVAHSSFVVAKTDRALYFFDPRDLDREPGRVEPVTTVPLRGEVENLARIHIAELIDSYLLSLVYGNWNERGYHEAKQVLAEVGFDGSYDIVSELALAPGPPAWYRHRGFLVSPFVQHAHDLLWAWIEPQREGRITFRDIVSHPVPGPIAILAFLVAVFSATATAWIAHRRHLPRAHRLAWTAGAFCTGFTGFLSFLFLTSRDERADVPRPVAPEATPSARIVPMEGLLKGQGWSS